MTKSLERYLYAFALALAGFFFVHAQEQQLQIANKMLVLLGPVWVWR